MPDLSVFICEVCDLFLFMSSAVNPSFYPQSLNRLIA
jgi:hypothetical protein